MTRDPPSMNQQIDRTVQTERTTLPGAEVLAAAKRFFARRNTIYSVFVEKEGPTYVALRGQGSEELIIGVAPAEGGTQVTGSTYLFDQQLARFLASLPKPAETVVATAAPPTPTPEAAA